MWWVVNFSFDYFLALALTIIFLGFAASTLGIVTVTTPSLTSALALAQRPPDKVQV